jgi:hypothetical protein
VVADAEGHGADEVLGVRAPPKTTNAAVQGKNVGNTGGWAPEVINAPCGL